MASKKLKRLSFQRQFQGLKRASGLTEAPRVDANEVRDIPQRREGNVPTWTGLLTHQDRRRSCCWRLKCVGSGNSRPSLLLIRCCGARRAAMGIRCSYCPVLLRVTFRLDRCEHTWRRRATPRTDGSRVRTMARDLASRQV